MERDWPWCTTAVELNHLFYARATAACFLTTSKSSRNTKYEAPQQRTDMVRSLKPGPPISISAPSGSCVISPKRVLSPSSLGSIWIADTLFGRVYALSTGIGGGICIVKTFTATDPLAYLRPGVLKLPVQNLTIFTLINPSKQSF